MRITEASIEQLFVIKELAYAIWPDAYAEILSKEQLNYMLEKFYSLKSLKNQFKNNHIFLLAEENNTFVGFASYEINCKTLGKTKLHKIYVLTTTQGSGIGKMLLQEVENRAKKASNTHLFLNVNKHNKAQKFYKNQGFSIVQEEVISIGNGFVMDDYIMEKRL